MKTTNITKWVLAVLMTVWFGVSFIYLAGDDDPENPLPIMLWIIIKALALGSLYLWGKVFKHLCDIKALPKILTDMPEEEDEFEEEEA